MLSRLTSRPMPLEEKPVDVLEDVAKAKDAIRLAELTVVFLDLFNFFCQQMHSGLKLYAGDAFISYEKPPSHERGSERSERASERVSVAEGASKASSLEQANK